MDLKQILQTSSINPEHRLSCSMSWGAGHSANWFFAKCGLHPGSVASHATKMSIAIKTRTTDIVYKFLINFHTHRTQILVITSLSTVSESFKGKRKSLHILCTLPLDQGSLFFPRYNRGTWLCSNKLQWCSNSSEGVFFLHFDPDRVILLDFFRILLVAQRWTHHKLYAI